MRIGTVALFAALAAGCGDSAASDGAGGAAGSGAGGSSAGGAAGAGGALARCADRTGVAGDHERTVASGGMDRRFLVQVPASYDGQSAVPLVLAFHGVLANGEIILGTTQLPDLAEQEGFIVAAGDGFDTSWNAGVCCLGAQEQNVDDVAVARAMVAALEEEFCIDSTRVYATGFSNGGAMSQRLACDAADLFAAVAPVGGSLALGDCNPSRPIPNLMINSIDDPVVPYDLGVASFDIWKGLNSCDDAPEVTEPTSDTSCETFRSCAGGATTALCSIEGVAHTWPGGPLDEIGEFEATPAAWDFLSQHTLPED